MIIQSRRVWIGSQFWPAQLEVEDGKIVRAAAYDTEKPDADYGSMRILPGFIDIHTHGAYGFDTNDAKPEGLADWTRRIPEEGVTSFLPTTVTQMPDVLLAAVKNVADVAEGSYEGAEILGIHFEGPFLDMKYKGAQPPLAIAVPDCGMFEKYQAAARGWIRYITLSPEHDPNYALTRYCASTGVVVSMGHSGASYEQALFGAANGAMSMTHVFNGMTPFYHRNPGMVGAAFRLKNIYGEVICDGHHSEPTALRMFFDAKGKDFGIMITDSLQAKHCAPGGHYQLGGVDITICDDGLARLSGTDTIAGSTLAMNRGLKVLIEDAEVPVEAAINSCTINPARCIGVDHRKGKLCAGYDADIAVLDDNYSVKQTYCRGKKML